MPFAIQTTDKPNQQQVRIDVRDEHVAYLKSFQASLVAAGALLEDEGSNGLGGLIIIDTEERSEAERFIANDPYTLAGLFENITVTRWRKAFLDGKCLL